MEAHAHIVVPVAAELLPVDLGEGAAWRHGAAAQDQDARRLDGEHAVRRIGRRRVARQHRHARQVARHGVEAGLPPRHNQHLRAETMKGFDQDAAETAAGADEGDGGMG